MKVWNHNLSFVSTCLTVILFSGTHAAWGTSAPTSTTLTMFSGAVTVGSGGSVDSGTEITLMASVKAGAIGVSPGQVNFCDASAASCADSHLLGTAQLYQTDPGSGIAFFNFRPGIGSHSYKAVFVGTPNGVTAYQSSASGNVSLTVTGMFPTKTSIVGSGTVGNYSLKGTVTGLVNKAGSATPSGTVLFPDTSNGSLSLGSASLGLGAEAFGFSNPSDFSTGTSPHSIAVGDFNGDGIVDLVTANSESDTLTILLGSGNANFTEAAGSPIRTGDAPSCVTIGDFNSDGKTDLAVSNYNDSTLAILLGNGNGTFSAAPNSPIAVGRAPLSVAVGDFSGDGIADLVVANVVDNTVSILLGKGDGTFTPAAGSPYAVVGSSPSSVAVADFNRDGKLDFVVAIVGPNDVTAFLGNGDGTFTKAPNGPVPVGLGPYSVIVGDFNGDGIPDLATANDTGVNNNPGTVTVLLGSGDGGFTQASGSPIFVGINPLIVASGDFNADGKVDLAVTNENDSSISVLLGNEDGTFTAAPSIRTAAGRFPLSVATGDFNGDGVADLVVSNTNLSDGSVMVLDAQITETAAASVNGISVAGTGTHLIKASYPGDSIYRPSLTIDPVGLLAGVAPAFTVAATGVIVAPGATTANVSTVTVTPAGGFTGNVALTARITSSPTGAQDLPTLSFGSTSPVTINGTAAAAATLTVSTTPATRAALMDPKPSGRASRQAEGSAGLAFILLFGLPARRRRWRTMLGMAILLVAFAGGLLGCGGYGAGGGTVTGTGNTGTTPGTYTVTVTGTSGTTTTTGTLTLTVQ